MAYDSNLDNFYSSLALDDFQFNTDMSLVIDDNSISTFISPSDSDLSTGYLQDALIEGRNQSKRRRLLLHDESVQQQDYWDSTRVPSHNINFLDQITNFNEISDEPLHSSVSSISDGEITLPEIFKASEEARLAPKTFQYSSSDYKDFTSSSDCGHRRRRMKLTTRVVYPFEVVKPGGNEGDMTLNDINERILMPPTRPVRHPVGDFACRPCVSPDGPGLSGKAVVAFTRIHTQGRGTITIVRTRG
ncbi:hypothetical protein BVC80_1031g12 [Macleaya cordata]|uniref:Protein XRI1 n=1 Tax=Macleaya cordata TaxID=56857 RepID=A0A200QVQ0_MACCD|nr:hypothetical protein BVC80_1031g12 [Macleaya cordata]